MKRLFSWGLLYLIVSESNAKHMKSKKSSGSGLYGLKKSLPSSPSSSSLSFKPKSSIQKRPKGSQGSPSGAKKEVMVWRSIGKSKNMGRKGEKGKTEMGMKKGPQKKWPQMKHKTKHQKKKMSHKKNHKMSHKSKGYAMGNGKGYAKGKGYSKGKGKGRFPFVSPTVPPKDVPTVAPTLSPSVPSTLVVMPTAAPTAPLTAIPTSIPNTGTSTGAPFPGTIMVPTTNPTLSPTSLPTQAPTDLPTISPTITPTSIPATNVPTGAPFPGMTLAPTTSPTTGPTAGPTAGPTDSPTDSPTLSPTAIPTVAPVDLTATPTAGPTESPTSAPVATTTEAPTETPTDAPTDAPTEAPTEAPTDAPTPDSSQDLLVHGLQPDCTQSDGNAFNICLDIRTLSGEVEEWFPLLQAARRRMERIIAEDPWPAWPLSAYQTLGVANIATELPQQPVDDIYIAVLEQELDGEGNLFASAGPNLVFAGNQIAAGSITIDPEDLQRVLDNDIFELLMLHEMAHVLGVGTLWTSNGFIDGDTYTGTNALAAWNDIGCSGDLPLEENLRQHWNEDCLEQELMTPFFRFNRPAPLSTITMGAFEDLGYVVNLSEVDAYGTANLGDCGNFCPEAGRRMQATNATLPAIPKLSQEGEVAILKAAAESFRQRERRMIEERLEPGPTQSYEPDTISFVYQENASFFSRIISRADAESYM